MLVVRRLYVYLISAVSLFVLAIGLANLLELGIAELWEQLSGTPVHGPAVDVRDEVSLYLALVAVSLPIWALHWRLAGRWAAIDQPESDRGSAVRALFFALVLAVALGNWLSNLGALVDTAIANLLGAEFTTAASGNIGAASIIVVAGGIWAFHLWIRRSDVGSLVMAGAGVWPVRLYVYAAALVGAIMLLAGIADLLTLPVDALAGDQQSLTGESWWAGRVATGLALVLVGGAVWGIHWFWSLSVLYRDDWQAASEQASSLRRAYLYLAVLVGVVVTLVALSFSLTELLRSVFGVDPGTGADPLWARVTNPLLIALPFAVFWVVHQRIIGEEAQRFASRPEQAAVARLYTYVVSFLALAFAAVGLAYLLGVLIEFGFESARILDSDPEWVPEQISTFLSITLIGTAVWIWHWARVQRRAATDPAGERDSTSRRVYLYLVLTATTLATLVALAIVLYQTLQVVLGVRSTEGIASDVGSLIGIVVVAGNLLAYHVLTLREDLRSDRGGEMVPEEPEAEPIPIVSLPLTLQGPENVDPRAVVIELRRHLPEGFKLHVDEPLPEPGNPSEPGYGVVSPGTAEQTNPNSPDPPEQSEEDDESETVRFELPEERDPQDRNPRIFS